MQPKIVNFGITNQTVDNIQYYSGFIDQFKDIYHPFWHIEVFFDSGNDKYDLMYLNQTIDVCSFLKNLKINIFFKIAHNLLSKYTAVPKNCPLWKVKSVKFSNKSHLTSSFV